MIQYALKCAEGHAFDSWFQSAAAFDKLVSAGMVSCAICGGVKVKKAIMAPRVRTARGAVAVPDVAPETGPVTGPEIGTATGSPAGPRVPSVTSSNPLSQPANPAEQALAELRKKVEDNADYVGQDFAAEARAMHLGDAPARSIYGEAGLDEAKQLVEDGVPVTPLPFRPNRKIN